MKKKRITWHLTGLLACLSFLPAQAQDEARTILDQVSKTLAGYQTIQADFSFTLSNQEAAIEDTFEGNLVIEGEKFRLKMMGMLILCDGNKLWNYSEEMNEAILMDPDESEFFNPTQIFTLYQKDFALTIQKNAKPVYDILLTPVKDHPDYHKILLRLNAEKNTIVGATYYGKDGNDYLLQIKNTIPNIQVDDRFFIFDPAQYPGSTVFDMR